MKRYPWLKLIKKSRPDPMLEPPFWLGDHSNGEYYHAQTPRDRLIRRMILERADVAARKHGIDRRQFLASSMGVATSLSVINFVAACGKESARMAPAMSSSPPPMPAAPSGMAASGVTPSRPSPMSAQPQVPSSMPGIPAAGGAATPASMPASMMPPAPASQAGSAAPSGVGGRYTNGDPMDPACTAELMLDSAKEFVFDIQTHHIERIGNDSYMSFFELGYPEQSACGKGLPGCFLRDEYITLMFLESQTSLAILSAVPAVDGELPITNDELAKSRDYINQLAHSQRVLIQGQVLPNYDLQRQLDGMDRLVAENRIASWKVHTEWGPANVFGNAPDGYFLDDMAVGIPFIEKARQTGVKVFCCHKGLPGGLFNAERCSPRDIPVVAKMFPDTSWVAYHSAYRFDGGPRGGETAYQEGSMLGIDSLITSMRQNGVGPNQNVYAELAGVWNEVMMDPTEAAHVLGKLLLYVGENNVLWGSDSIWVAKPQPYVDAFWNFEITEEFQMMFGYPALTQELKRKILSGNSARLFNIDIAQRRCVIDAGALAAASRTFEGELGPMRYIGDRPLGPTTRREYLRLAKWREFLKVPG